MGILFKTTETAAAYYGADWRAMLETPYCVTIGRRGVDVDLVQFYGPADEQDDRKEG